MPPVARNPMSIAAIALGKAAGTASRIAGYGGGTSAPGLLALRIDHGLVSGLSSQLSCGALLVTGTNGKTTTARLIANMAKQSGLFTIHNSSGSNMMRGIATALLKQASLTAKILNSSPTIGIFEVDEATLPEAINEIHPSAVVVTNLFRDQLDRYGELDTIASTWKAALDCLPDNATIVLNADDPLVASLGDHPRGNVVYFGLASGPWSGKRLEHAADSVDCIKCQNPLDYTDVFLGHLGHYKCPRCGWGRPEPAVFATDIKLHSFTESSLRVSGKGEDIFVRAALPGLYNVYNVTAAIAAAMALTISVPAIQAGIKDAEVVFGRGEFIQIGGRKAYLVLAKNPVGMNQVLRTLPTDHGSLNIMFILNDMLADGTDISWIWDVDFECLKDRVGLIAASGRRAEDMAVRLKYAGLAGDGGPNGTKQALVDSNIGHALDSAIASINETETLYIVPTYTAMLEVRSLLTKRGALKKYWTT
ncbi:MAG: DUF1727 domain-containing protein [Dehalococcoidia bacterium]|nr:DUF1727 domain-containing protein [Dehalococcoidia bacterium]